MGDVVDHSTVPQWGITQNASHLDKCPKCGMSLISCINRITNMWFCGNRQCLYKWIRILWSPPHVRYAACRRPEHAVNGLCRCPAPLL
jgi:hypothetical protein